MEEGEVKDYSKGRNNYRRGRGGGERNNNSRGRGNQQQPYQRKRNSNNNNDSKAKSQEIKRNKPEENEKTKLEYDSSASENMIEDIESEEEEEEEENDKQQERQQSYLSITEKDVGISEFIHSGFGLLDGKLKICPEDFYVKEVQKDGTVITLKNPAKKIENNNNNNTTNNNTIGLSERMNLLKTDLSIRVPMLSNEDYLTIETLIENGTKQATAILSTPILDKSLRGLVHQTFRKHLHPLITSTTTNDQKIQIQKASQDLLRKDQRRLKADSNLPAHVEFTLRKTNVDSNHCITEISKLTKIPRKSFIISGTKDKRAVTCQKVTIRHGNVEDLSNRCAGIMICGKPDQTFEIGDIQATNETNFLGNLLGNQFTIAIKELKRKNTSSSSSSSLDLSIWSQKGFINYFGLQRFGTGGIATHTVGIALVERNYSETINLILKPRLGEDERLNQVRKEYEENLNAEMLFQNLPHRCTAERAIANGLMKYGKDDLWKVLQMIPRNTLTMYLHAVQSFVWNHIASLRFTHYGCSNVVIGDTVLVDNNVIRIENEKQCKQFSIQDVVLALPGNHVEYYPTTEFVNINSYEKILKDKLGMKNGLNQFNETSPRELILPGSYRAFIVIPSNVNSKLINYNESKETFFTREGLFNNDVQNIGNQEALLLTFTLPAGTYATMALRELLHCTKEEE